jgi:hypothetical protein
MLTVKSVDKGDIRVVLDGRRFESGSNSLMINGLESGYHTIKIFRQKFNGGFNIHGKRYEMVYSTSLMVRAKAHVRITIDRFGRTSIDERKIRGNYYDRYDNGRDYDRDRDSRGRDNDFDKNKSSWIVIMDGMMSIAMILTAMVKWAIMTATMVMKEEWTTGSLTR